MEVVIFYHSNIIKSNMLSYVAIRASFSTYPIASKNMAIFFLSKMYFFP